MNETEEVKPPDTRSKALDVLRIDQGRYTYSDRQAETERLKVLGEVAGKLVVGLIPSPSGFRLEDGTRVLLSEALKTTCYAIERIAANTAVGSRL